MTLTFDIIARRLATCAATQGSTALAGDHALNPGFAPPGLPRPAAVLIPLLQRGGGLHVLFTRRSPHLSAHAGQISFPGGRVDAADADDTAAALREASEEIGLPPESVQVVTTLRPYLTRTGFRVSPVVGYVPAAPAWKPQAAEVEEIFEVPLQQIMTPGWLRCETVPFEGDNRQFYACQWGPHRIWGATAGMLKNLVDLIGEAA